MKLTLAYMRGTQMEKVFGSGNQLKLYSEKIYNMALYIPKELYRQGYYRTVKQQIRRYYDENNTYQ